MADTAEEDEMQQRYRRRQRSRAPSEARHTRDVALVVTTSSIARSKTVRMSAVRVRFGRSRRPKRGYGPAVNEDELLTAYGRRPVASSSAISRARSRHASRSRHSSP